MSFTTEQLLYINTIMYARSPWLYGEDEDPNSSYEGKTLKDFATDLNAQNSAGLEANAQEWEMARSFVMQDKQLCNLVVADTYVNDQTGEAECLLVDPTTNDAVLVFKGTGKYEWKDNFVAATTMDDCGVDPFTGQRDPTISVQQGKALDYAQGLNLSQYNHVTVTGHSKGGNKAKLCSLYFDDIDSCVSFDGQGFSDEFMAAHSDKIALNQGKIENHNVEGDFVNLLLNDIGTVQYYQGQRMGNNYAENHAPASFYTSEGTMIPGTQSQAMQNADTFLHSYLRSMTPEQKKNTANFLGDVAQCTFAYNGEGLSDIILDPKNADELAYLLAYTLKYEQATGDVTDSVKIVFNDLGMNNDGIINILSAVIQNETVSNAVRIATLFGDDIPGPVYDLIGRIAKQAGLDLPMDTIRNIITIVGKASDYTAQIHIDTNSGDDIYIPGVQNGSAGNAPVYQEVDMTTDMDISGEAAYIFVHFSKLTECCRELNVALEYFVQAVQNMQNAANDLASKWEGAAKEAFCIHQQNAFRWYKGISSVIEMIIQMITRLISMYSETEGRVQSIMNG